MESNYKQYENFIHDEAELLMDELSDMIIEEISVGTVDVQGMVLEYVEQHMGASSYANDIDLFDSAYILDQSSNIETDSGLWEGLELVEQLEAKAYWTLVADVRAETLDQAESFLKDTIGVYEDELTELDERIERLEVAMVDVHDQLEELIAREEGFTVEQEEALDGEMTNLEADLEDANEEVRETTDLIDNTEHAYRNI